MSRAATSAERPRQRSVLLDAEAIEAFEPDAKIALLATIDEGGLPHLTLITSLAAKDATTLTFGQFCEGQSKRNLAERPEAAFLVMTRDRRLWTGRARWRGKTRQGEDYEAYNRRPMFRYNAYFGIHTVHYLDVVRVDESQRLSLPRLALSAMRPALGRLRLRSSEAAPAAVPLRSWTRRLFARPGTLAFTAHVAEDGWPSITPLVTVSVAGTSAVRIATSGRGRALESLPEEHPLALLALNLQMESVLLRGRLAPAVGVPRRRYRRLSVDWVYNSMPPKQGVVYPRARLRPVEQF